MAGKYFRGKGRTKSPFKSPSTVAGDTFVGEASSRRTGSSPLRIAPSNSACSVQGDLIGCRTGNGEILSNSQAEPGQFITSAVA